MAETSEQVTVKLTDLYDEQELTDPREMLSNYVDEDDLQREFVVHTMTPEQARTYKTPRDDMTVFEAFRRFAGRDQKRFVREQAAHFDHGRIIVTMFQTVVDGNHHLVAGILAKQPIRYINLADSTVQEARETGGAAPIQSVKELVAWGETIGVYASVSEKLDEIELVQLDRDENAPKGRGAEFMRALCAYADRKRKSVYLATVGWNDALPTYYRQFGFRRIGSRDEETGDMTMIRKPRRTVTETGGAALREGRDAPLYHGCSFFAATQCMKDDSIEDRTLQTKFGHGITGVSLTRDIRVARTFGPVVFELDQQLLSHRHRLVPVDYWGNSTEAQLRDMRRKGEYAEAEEFCVGPVRHLSRVLRAIHINRKDYDKVLRRSAPEWQAENALLFNNPKLRIE